MPDGERLLTAGRQVQPSEFFDGALVSLRLVTLDDCTPTYVAWLNDPEIHRYLETRWTPQSLESVRSFVARHSRVTDSYLFAVIVRATRVHVGNIKIGPINPHHMFADVSYFIGDRASWGRGYATDAIRVAVDLGFRRLRLHRIQAGVYATNVASQRALEKAGFRLEGISRRHLHGADGWEDQLCYGVLGDDREAGEANDSRR